MVISHSRLDPLTARRFRTGRPCLDFVHTGGVGNWIRAELIHDATDLRRWLAYLLDVQDVRARLADVDRTRALREAIWLLAQARVADRPLGSEHVSTVNAFAVPSPPRLLLDDDGSSRTETPTASGALSALARDAIDLFGGPLGHRIRECAASDCQLLFVDASGPGRRRWCSMERCGNRAKVRAHRAAKSSDVP